MEYINLWEEIPFYDQEKQDANPENENTPTLTPFLFKDGKIHPAVLIVPGGGYSHRATEKKVLVSEYFRKWGVHVFMLNYRVQPYMHPVILNDCKRAIRFLKHNAEKYLLNKEKISVIGFSAGAHLAACAVLSDNKYDFEKRDKIDEEDTSIFSLGLCYPVISLCEDYAHKGSGNYLLGDDEDTKRELSIEKMDMSRMPPVFMWHTFEDKSVPIYNSLEMAKVLKKNDKPFEYHIFPQGKHGSGLALDIEGTEQWSLLYKNWLERINFF